jgi:hypothetical protein
VFAGEELICFKFQEYLVVLCDTSDICERLNCYMGFYVVLTPTRYFSNFDPFYAERGMKRKP